MWSVGGSQAFQFEKLFVADVIRPRFSTAPLRLHGDFTGFVVRRTTSLSPNTTDYSALIVTIGDNEQFITSPTLGAHSPRINQ
jgi:hypothetical protein